MTLLTNINHILKIDKFKHVLKIVNFGVCLYTLGCLVLALPTLFNLPRLFGYRFQFYNEFTGSALTGLWLLAWFTLIVVGYLALITNPNVRFSKVCFLLAVVCFFITPPFGSTDVFYYIGAARDEIMNGINPYLGGFSKINPFLTPSTSWAGPIMYPPLWLQINKLLWTLSQGFGILGQVYFYKFFFLVCHIITTLIIAKIINGKWLMVNDKLPILYFLNPLLLFEFAGNAHFDALMLLFVALAILSTVQQKTTRTFVFLTLAVLIKYTAILFVPFLVLYLVLNDTHLVSEQSERSKITQLRNYAISVVVSLAIAAISFYPYWIQIGPKIFSGISTQNDWFVNSLFSTLYVPIIWLYHLITNSTIPSISAKYLWIILILTGLTILTKHLLTKFKMVNGKWLMINNRLNLFETTTLFVIIFLTFTQRSYWPWYATWPFLTGVLLGTENKLFKLSLTFTLSSFAFYLIYTFFGFNSTQTLDNLQVLYGLVVFAPVLLSFQPLLKNCHPRESGDPEYVKL